MKKKIIWIIAIFLCIACESNDDSIFTTGQLDNTNQTDNTNDDNPINESEETPEALKLLSLGDSYTIGQSVCVTCRFPVQLKDSIYNNLNRDTTVDIIAQTGWTTTDLLEAILDTNPSTDHDIVTLLIGVNNQYQGQPFNIYEQEFPVLVNKATSFAKGDSSNVIVVSIPDYAYTLFGQNFGNPTITSQEIDSYNAFAEDYCNANDITFVNITDITRDGLINPELVAVDNLHPSELAYSLFVERILPIALDKIE